MAGGSPGDRGDGPCHAGGGVTTEMATPETAPLTLSVDLTVEQAQQVVDEIAILWNHANRDGKRKVRVLNVLCNTLIRELTAIRDERESQP